MSRKYKKIFDVGIMDIRDEVFYTDLKCEVSSRKKRVWICPFYQRWMNMLNRCYGKPYQKVYHTYKDCKVCDEWLVFSNFASWMIKQDFEGKQLDKDILFPGNKIYGPDTCVFVDKDINTYFIEKKYSEDDFLPGVAYIPRRKERNFMAQCSTSGFEPFSQKTIGYYHTELEAHQAWLKYKKEIGYKLAEKQSDKRIFNAIIRKIEALDYYAP